MPTLKASYLNNMKGMHRDPKVGVYSTMQKVEFLEKIIAIIALVKSKLKIIGFICLNSIQAGLTDEKMSNAFEISNSPFFVLRKKRGRTFT